MSKLYELAKLHWPQVLSLLVGGALILWAVGCPPRARSPLNPQIKMTLPQLDAELKALIAQYNLRTMEIEEQEQIRKVIINNALIMAQTGTVNPLGIITGLAALYGVGSAANSTKNIIKRKKTVNGNSS